MEWDQVQDQPMQKEIERNLISLANIAKRKDILHSDVGKDLMLSVVSVIKWGMKLLFAQTGKRLLIQRRSTCLSLHDSLVLNQVKIDLLTVVVLTT